MMRRGWIARGIGAACCLAGCWAACAAADGIKEADACGFVVDGSGAAVSEATIAAVSGGKTLATTTTLSDGSFHFEDSISGAVVLLVNAKGLSAASEPVSRLHPAAKENKCKHPIYAVLVAGAGQSFVTTKKKDVPRTSEAPDGARKHRL